MLELKNLKKIFSKGTINERVATDNLNLVLNDGDFVTVIGSNGAGKSTMLNLIAGTYFPDGGEIILDGKNITKLKEYERAKYLGRVFQDPMMGTCPNMQIAENLALSMRRGKVRTLKWGVPNLEKEGYKKELERLGLGLEDRLNDKVKLLSGGQRQALTLLMATIKRPSLLLLDEHTAALDPKTADSVLTLTNEIVNEEKLTTIMITHNMRDAIKYGNRLVMMDSGKIIYDVSGEEKKNLTVKDLLSRFENTKQGVSDQVALS